MSIYVALNHRMHSPIFYLLFACYFILCAYIGWSGLHALPRNRVLRACWITAIAILSLSFVVSMLVLRRGFFGSISNNFLRGIGTTWIVSTPYWATAALFWQILARINKRRRILPWVEKNYALAKFLAFAATIVVTAAIFAAGYIHFHHPVTTTLRIKIPKLASLPASSRANPASPPGTLHIALAADLHLGDTVGVSLLHNYVDRINALNADIILLPGDIIDRGITLLEEQDMGDELARLHAPLGVYAVLGNHEGFAGAAQSAEYLARHNIRVLRDKVLPLAGGAFYLAGRNDFSYRDRAPLSKLLAGLDRSRPIILLDHQPRDLWEPAAQGVDLQFSGHTHGGQIWPVTWIVSFIYDDAYGYMRKNNFQLYVTSGLGLWGFPARIGSSSEIVDIHVEFGTP